MDEGTIFLPHGGKIKVGAADAEKEALEERCRLLEESIEGSIVFGRMAWNWISSDRFADKLSKQALNGRSDEREKLLGWGLAMFGTPQEQAAKRLTRPTGEWRSLAEPDDTLEGVEGDPE